MSYYVRAKGANRYAGGTARWLRIRRIEVDGTRLSLEIKFGGAKKYLALSGVHQHNLEFAKGKWPNVQPVSWYNIRKELGYV